MRVLCVFSQFNYGDPQRGEGHEFSHFIPALRRLGHTTDHFETRNRSNPRGFASLNRALLKHVECTRPDLILAAQTHYELWTETWDAIRDGTNCATVNWATDDSWKYGQFSRFLAPSFHTFATTCARRLTSYHADHHNNVVRTQWACNAEALNKPLPAASCSRCVTFIGTATPRRRKVVATLAKRGIQVECHGYGWPSGPLDAAAIPAILRESLISLNFSAGRNTMGRIHNQLKARVFEVPCAGGFLLTENSEGLDAYYETGVEVATFASLDELVSQIRRFLGNHVARDALAIAGYERTSREHTYGQRLAEVIAFTLSHRNEAERVRRDTSERSIDWARFEDAVGRYERDTPWRWVAKPVEGICATVWGAQRGRRAARRLWFEVCWRVSGKSAYSAGGLPGRLFSDVP